MKTCCIWGIWLLCVVLLPESLPAADFRAGAAMVDISPVVFPVRVNGMVEERTATVAHDRLMSRALVLDDTQDNTSRLAIVVVDSLMLTRDMLDDVKQQASQQTGIPPERMLISATHTHSAPSAMPCLGSRADPEYSQFLPGQIVRSIVQANERLVDAQAGWVVTTDDVHNHCRRWIFRSDRMVMTDPFGQHNVRAHMHPGHMSPNHVGPSGPADTDLTLLAIQTREGQPLAVLGNYAMHYYGSPLVSGDFCGRFGDALAEEIGAKGLQPSFVGMMSQGTSGDSMWPDYSQPAGKNDLDAYTREVAKKAAEAYRTITYRSDVSLAMAEATLKLNRRTPDEARLKWASEMMAKVGDRLPQGWSQVYSFEQKHLHEDPTAELRLQAIRVGDLGITAIPDEVFGITGLKLKQRSPLPLTMNIELANGAEGYIPPPEQHALGGYTTWPARTAGLEVQAEPKIVETLTKLLERVAGKPAKPVTDETHDYAKRVLASKPAAYWRLGELEGTPATLFGATGLLANDAVGKNSAVYEPGIAFYLPGPRGSGLQQAPRGNRAVQFAGGRLHARLPNLSESYSFECWVWNGYPNSDRAVTGYFFSRGPSGNVKAPGDHLGIGGNYLGKGWDGKLLVFNGNDRDEALAGRTVLSPRTWHHVAFVRNGTRVTVYLDGNKEPDIDGDLTPTFSGATDELFLGGRTDGLFGLEGRLDEAAVYDRVLTANEVASHYSTAAASHDPQINETIPRADSEPVSASESLKKIHVRDGFEVQLVVAEPLVIDPVAIDWSVDGKLWVAEMADYPNGMDDNGKPGGRIRFLEDSDNDGQYDASTVFLTEISFPNGVMSWGKGVLVTAAPEIFYAEDTDGDGKADVRKTLYSGFLEGNQQLRVNGLRWGLDNWIYCASGSHHPGYGADSQILSHLTNQKTAVGSRDFCIRPETGAIEPASGPSQFGRNRDAWGQWFGEQNSYPLWHYVLEDGNIRRNPHYAPPDPRKLLTPSNPRVYSAAPPEKRFHSFEQSGRYTSACSGMIYLDDLLFADSSPNGVTESDALAVQHVFTCEPFSNLIQHNLLIDDGVSFRLERDPAEEGASTDFFASEDRWCRPVMVRTGPDGALWVVDMYRYMIEHPQWLPKEGQDELRPFFRSGDDRGRIYRIVPKGAGQKLNPPAFLKQRKNADLVADLESSNGWLRDTAQQQLVARGEQSAKIPLEKILSTSQRPTARVHALCTLEGLGCLTDERIQTALKDSHPAVRRWAVRLAPNAGVPIEQLKPLVQDPHLKVRLELANIAAQYREPASGEVLADLLSLNSDRNIRAAVMSSLHADNVRIVAERFLTVVRDHSGTSGENKLLAGYSDADRDDLCSDLCEQTVLIDNSAEMDSVLTLLTGDADSSLATWQMKGLSGILRQVSGDWTRLTNVIGGETVKSRLMTTLEQARRLAVDTEQSTLLRAAAVELALMDQASKDNESLVRSLLTPQTPVDVQQAMIQKLAEHRYEFTPTLMLASWSAYTPTIRASVLNLLAARPEWMTILIDRMESGDVSTAELDAPTRQRLLATRDDALKSRLQKLFAADGTSDRRTVIEQLQSTLKLTGDSTRGEAVFRKRCATCHRQNGFGAEVGPNLASLTNRTPETLLTAILDPSAAVEAKYLNFVAVTTSGRSVTGILTTETASSLTFVATEGKTETLLRTDIEELKSTGKSLMPEGLEKDVTPQEIADVIEFVRGLKQ